MSGSAPPGPCCLTGSAGFTVLCGEKLLAAGHEVVVVVSSNAQVVGWATGRGIPVLTDFDELVSSGAPLAFDYLFSVVNGVLLPPEVLRLPRVAAINYHNGPLPRYAGVHAASWALLNGEPVHGVTWHRMVQRVDAGPIYAQRLFPTAGLTSAAEINDTCRQFGLDLLGELLAELAGGCATAVPQDLARRTYYPGCCKHQWGGLVPWRREAATVVRIVGAHQVGPVKNTFGSAKLDLGHGAAVVGRAAATGERSTEAPGTVVAVRDGGLRVATRTDDVQLLDLTDFGGRALTAQELPRSGRRLPSVAPGLPERLGALLEAICLHESFCAATIDAADQTPLPTAGTRGTTSVTLETPIPARRYSADATQALVLAATILTVWERTGRSRVSVHDDRMPADTDLARFVREGLPVTGCPPSANPVPAVLAQVYHQRATAHGRDLFARDLTLRRTLRRTELPVSAAVLTSTRENAAAPGAQLAVVLAPAMHRLTISSTGSDSWSALRTDELESIGRRLTHWLALCATE